MRLVIVIVVIALSLIVDQYRFSGYYRQSLIDGVQRTWSRIVN